MLRHKILGVTSDFSSLCPISDPPENLADSALRTPAGQWTLSYHFHTNHLTWRLFRIVSQLCQPTCGSLSPCILFLIKATRVTPVENRHLCVHPLSAPSDASSLIGRKAESHKHTICLWPCLSALPIDSLTASLLMPLPLLLIPQLTALRPTPSHAGFLKPPWVRSVLCLKCPSSDNHRRPCLLPISSHASPAPWSLLSA